MAKFGIDGDITSETLSSLIAFSNIHSEDNEIYICSGGGNYHSSEAIINVIKPTDTIIAYGKICSSAFEIFFRAKCKKVILENCYGMYHQSSTSIAMDERWQPTYKVDEFLKTQIVGSYKNMTNKMSEMLNFTEAEKRKLKKGQDVFFSTDRLREILKNAREI